MTEFCRWLSNQLGAKIAAFTSALAAMTRRDSKASKLRRFLRVGRRFMQILHYSLALNDGGQKNCEDVMTRIRSNARRATAPQRMRYPALQTYVGFGESEISAGNRGILTSVANTERQGAGLRARERLGRGL